MSGYDMKFADAIIRDAELDNIIDADDEDKIIDQITCTNEAEDPFIVDHIDNTSIENGAKGLGDDLGTKHATKGAFAPTKDSSDAPIVKQERSDTGKSPIINNAPRTQTSAEVDERNISDEMMKNGNKVKKMELEMEQYTDKFDKAQDSILEDADNDIAAAQSIVDKLGVVAAPNAEDVADDVDAATGLDTPIPTASTDIPIGDDSNTPAPAENSVLSVGEGKLEDLIVGDHADSTIKDGKMVTDFNNAGENVKSTVNDGQDLAVGDHADASAKDGKMVTQFNNDEEDGKNTDDSFKEASVSSSEDLVDELEDEDIDEVEDNTETDKEADRLAKDLADDEDEEDDLLDQLLD